MTQWIISQTIAIRLDLAALGITSGYTIHQEGCEMMETRNSDTIFEKGFSYMCEQCAPAVILDEKTWQRIIQWHDVNNVRMVLIWKMKMNADAYIEFKWIKNSRKIFLGFVQSMTTSLYCFHLHCARIQPNSLFFIASLVECKKIKQKQLYNFEWFSNVNKC